MFMVNVILLGLVVGGAFGGSGILGLAVMTVSILNGSYSIGSVGDLLVYIVIYGLLGGLVVIAWRNFWLPLLNDWLTISEQRAGILRRGIFLTDELMLLRLQTRYCDIIPRQAILSLERRGSRYASWVMIYRVSEGKQKNYWLDSFIDNHRQPRAVSQIREWAGLRDDSDK
jgi:hypothetical protein